MSGQTWGEANFAKVLEKDLKPPYIEPPPSDQVIRLAIRMALGIGLLAGSVFGFIAGMLF